MSNVIETGVSSEQMTEVYAVATLMRTCNLTPDFIDAAVQRARNYEGTVDLMLMWRDEQNPEEQDAIIADIQEAIDDGIESPSRVSQRPYVRFENLEGIAQKIQAFKQGLRNKVDEWGGVSQLAMATGIPQPSLSRFFNSTSMPRRTTLYKIANALNLSEDEIATDWIR